MLIGSFGERPTHGLRLAHRANQGKRDHGRALWCVLNLLIWHDLFVSGQGYLDHLNVGDVT